MGLYIPVEKMCTSIEPAMIQKPSKELDLGRETSTPNAHHIRRDQRIMEQMVSTPRSEGLHVHGSKKPNIMRSGQGDLGEVAGQDIMFSRSRPGEPRTQIKQKPISDHCTNGNHVNSGVGVEGREPIHQS